MPKDAAICVFAEDGATQPEAKKALREIYNAEDGDHALVAVVESTFTTVRLRTKVAKGVGSEAAVLGHGVQVRRVRPAAVTSPERTFLVALVRVGARFERGRLVERAHTTAEMSYR